MTSHNDDHDDRETRTIAVVSRDSSLLLIYVMTIHTTYITTYKLFDRIGCPTPSPVIQYSMDVFVEVVFGGAVARPPPKASIDI